MAEMEDLELRIERIEMRNIEVEMNKAWETSNTRKFLIALFTYLAIALYMRYVLGIDPWINALVPTAGFLLSTLTLSFFKSLWGKYLYKRK
jgi:hypothetical protein